MSLRQRFFLLFFAVCLAAAAEAQVTQADNTTSPPIPGVGHDYIHLLSETVNPANGAVSLRIQPPTVKGRGISLPFSIAYDSNAALHVMGGDYPSFGTAAWSDNTGYLAQGGWSYSLPTAGSAGWDVTAGTYPNFYTCSTTSDYMFSDPAGGQHSLYLGTQASGNGPCPDAGRVSLTGGDGQVVAQLPTGFPPIQVSTADGTVFHFNGRITHPANSILVSLPTTIEDRNGNVLNVQDNGSNGNFVVTDTAGRTAISSSGFGPTGTTNTVSVGGMNYQIAWKQSTKSFPTQWQWAGPSWEPDPTSDACSPIASGSGSQTVASSITLPNGKQYKFYYGADNPDPTYNNPYGLLSEIDYPDGGWVKYTWKVNATMDELADYPGAIAYSGPDCSSDPQVVCYRPVQDGCLYIYKTPVVATRQVGFGGSSTPSLTQTFIYSTTWTGLGTQRSAAWTQKTTTLTTTDNVLNKSSLTAYTYQSTGAGNNNVFGNTTISPQIPVEKTVQYYDFNSSLLRTVNKTWANLYDLASEQTILENSLSSQTVYSYTSTAPFQLKETDEYDFGQSAPSRKTISAYQTFPPASSGGMIVDKPCKTVVYNGAGASLSETDFLYDGGKVICGNAGNAPTAGVPALPSGTHDETNYGPSATIPRGNVTTKIERCFPLPPSTQPCADVVTTYSYDETGQVTSMVDGNGNAPGGSPSQHTTTYSYADSFSSGGPPSGNTNAFLSQITHPSTNGVSHVENFSYDYASGKLTSSTDPNLRVTSYKYNTPPTGCSFPDGLDRLSEIDSPDNGKTTYCYNDAPYNASTPSPSVTTTKAITSSLNLVTVSASDGVGHLVKTILSSDPEGADTTDTTYDGLGRVRTQSNPHRSAPHSTDGISTHLYDALGRPCLTVPQDLAQPPLNAVCPTAASLGSVFSSYAGNCTTVTDEAGKSRQSCSDALGRLAQVFEDPAHLNYETDYQYDVLGNLQSVTQKGGSVQANWRIRNFQYNSLSRLLSANNPESGTVSYSYDANGNLLTKKDARGVATTMAYDALNRVLSKTYSDGTPTANFYYDIAPAPWAPSALNTNGRLVEATTGITPEP